MLIELTQDGEDCLINMKNVAHIKTINDDSPYKSCVYYIKGPLSWSNVDESITIINAKIWKAKQ